MTMLFGDTFDTVPASKPGASANSIILPGNIVDALLRGFSITSEGALHHIYTDVGAISEREVLLAAGGNCAQKLYIATANPAAAHLLSGAVKFCRDPLWGSSTTKQGVQHCLAGWNAGCTSTVGTIASNDSLLTVDEAGNLKIGTLSVTQTAPLPYDTYVSLEIEIIPATTTINVYINKALALTTSAGPASVAALGWVAAVNGSGVDSAIRVDDMCFMDYTGAAPWNARPADVLSFVRIPLVAVSGTPAFAPINAATNLDAVNKNTLDTLAFNRSGSADDVGDLFTLDGSALSESQSVLGVILQSFCRKTALTPRALDLTISDGVDTANSAFSGMDVTYKGPLAQNFFPTQPDGVTPWTVDAAKALQVGYTVRSGA